MNADTITTRLHAKADADLKKKIAESVKWIWEATQGMSGSMPKLVDHKDLETAMRNTGSKWESMPWIGGLLDVFKKVAFAYLRDKWRSQYVSDFMGKVESMAAEMENLGIVIQQQEESRP